MYDVKFGTYWSEKLCGVMLDVQQSVMYCVCSSVKGRKSMNSSISGRVKSRG